ncbi:HAD-IA family hydrolase [Phaeobacter sp. CAU 1743]|uniref:HAD family hydrolase n=1 Tax=Phaeobacter sp. CAU 1743 TaxID=3140367 RepID=UPI00325A6BAF
MNNILSDIDVIVFDAFGTLIEITDRRRPVAHLKRRMSPEKVSLFRRLAMTTNMTLPAIDAEIEGGATIGDFVVSQAAIAREVSSVRVRPRVREMLAALPVPYGLCSNISVDYVSALDRFPEIKPMFRIFSCFSGCMKPDPRIYELVLETSGVSADRILFVGDTPAADIDGPVQAGMRAMHIEDLIAALTGGGAGTGRPDTFLRAFRAARGSISKDLDIES